jgi:4-amino-4-deoxy-L-arabinose transferase-like glycosyltransferase
MLLEVDMRRARRAGVVAALIVATAGQMMISSLAIMSDATGLMWATLSAWLTLRYARTLRPATMALAAFTLGAAVITRWVFGLLALPWSVCVLLAWRRDWQAIGWRRAIGLALMALVAGGSVVAAQLSLGSEHTGDLQTVGWDPANAFRREVTNPDGAFQYDLPIGIFYASTIVQPSYIFPLFVPLWLAGLWALGYYESAPRALLIGWPLIGYLFLAGIAWQSTRFALMFFPALAAWVALGFDYLIEARPRWRRVVIALAALGVVASLLWSMRATGNFIAQNKNADLARVRFVADRIAPDARVLTFSISPTFEHYTALDVVELYHETPDSLTPYVCDLREVYVFVNVESIESQWQGLAPALNYRWLRDRHGLETIGRFDDYTLFKVEGDCA